MIHSGTVCASRLISGRSAASFPREGELLRLSTRDVNPRTKVVSPSPLVSSAGCSTLEASMRRVNMPQKSSAMRRESLWTGL